MQAFVLPVAAPLRYNTTGKFQSATPEWRHLARRLEDFELILVTAGALYLEVAGQEYHLLPGDYLLCPPFVGQRGTRPGECAFYWLHFTFAGITEPVAAVEHPGGGEPEGIGIPQTGTAPEPERLAVMLRQLQDAVRNHHGQAFRDHFTTAILLELHHQLQDTHQSSGPVRHRQLQHDIVDYIRWNQDADLKVAQVAEHFGYNPKYLSHLFSRLTGRSLKQYIVENKIQRAKYLLADTGEPITAIAGQLGFQDSHNFMKLFKKHMGMTPTEYRNTCSKRLMNYL